ncbi:hypothetical protein ACQ859_16730 [Roseateles chitinivorans]|uniref:hypothetical protein n=1 Tax=Roseateles chitinivorans TaxID=2917965 RepID=UPI003D6753FE
MLRSKTVERSQYRIERKETLKIMPDVHRASPSIVDAPSLWTHGSRRHRSGSRHQSIQPLEALGQRARDDVTLAGSPIAV